jgi:hypothetical protein
MPLIVNKQHIISAPALPDRFHQQVQLPHRQLGSLELLLPLPPPFYPCRLCRLAQTLRKTTTERILNDLTQIRSPRLSRDPQRGQNSKKNKAAPAFTDRSHQKVQLPKRKLGSLQLLQEMANLKHCMHSAVMNQNNQNNQIPLIVNKQHIISAPALPDRFHQKVQLPKRKLGSLQLL